VKGIWYRKPSRLSSAIYWLMGPLGRAANHVDWRFGRPFGTTPADLQALREHTVPGSVVLTHTDYNLLNKVCIPGRWEHAAMVVNKDHVIEATGKGVHVTSFEDLLSHCDDICILEPTFASPAMMDKAVDYAMAQLGKPYDFEFDYQLEGGQAFYCSELVWSSYDNACKPLVAPFQPGYIMGQYTLAPQNIYDSEYWTRVYASKETT